MAILNIAFISIFTQTQLQGSKNHKKLLEGSANRLIIIKRENLQQLQRQLTSTF